MIRLSLGLVVLTLVACEGGGDPVEQAVSEASARNHASTVKDGTVSGPQPSADAAYATALIDQNERAIAQAQAMQAATSDPEVRRLADAVVETRTREIADARRFLAELP